MSLNPFYIKTAQGAGTDNQASDINSNYPNGATSGVVSWTPTSCWNILLPMFCSRWYVWDYYGSITGISSSVSSGASL